MIVITKVDLPDERLEEIITFIERREGVQAHVSRGTDRIVIGLVGKVDVQLGEQLRAMKGVESVIKISKTYKLASRDFHPDDTIIEIKGVKIGGGILQLWGDLAQ